jgi:manganese/zinc/iron transport system permease protein
MDNINILVFLTTSLLGMTAGLLGVFAVLRGRALVGDVLAHAALPGICLAFLLVGRRDMIAFLVGALVVAVLAVIVMNLVRRLVRTKEDAALGIVLSVFFGLGIVLLSVIQKLPTGGAKAGLATYLFGQAAAVGRSDLYVILAMAVLAGSVVLLMYKELLVVTFDPTFARVQGWPVATIDLLLMTLVALVTIIGLPAVGVVLMAALLIIPPAAARFWTDRMGRMVLVAAGIGATSAILGTAISAGWIPLGVETGRGHGLPTGPMIILSGTSIFLISMIFAPEKGLVPRLARHWAFRFRTAREHLLRELYEHVEPFLPEITPVTVVELRRSLKWGVVLGAICLWEAGRRGWIRIEGGQVRLLPAGLAEARRVVRAHRLWELFLVDQVGIPADHVHRDADQMEHLLPPEYLAQLEEGLSPRLEVSGRPSELPPSLHAREE